MKKLAPLAILGAALLFFAPVEWPCSALEVDGLSSQKQSLAAEEGAGPSEKNPYDSPEAFETSENKLSSFPIEVSFKLPRSFGFHLGDEINLVMVINARPGVVVDLVNLPRKGEGHGPFEVKYFKIRSAKTKDAVTYEVDYVLQSFMPIFTVEKIVFPPLEILYADRPEGKSLGGALNYKSLVSQPFPIAYSRTATYFGPMIDIKGTFESGWKAFILSSLILGLLTISFSTILMVQQYVRKKRISAGVKQLSPYERAVQEFNAAQEAYYIKGSAARDLYFNVSKAFRNFLSESYSINASSKTAPQIQESFKGDPSQVEIVQLISTCEDVVYGGYVPGPADVDRTLRLYLRLIDKIGGPANGNGHTAPAKREEIKGQDHVFG